MNLLKILTILVSFLYFCIPAFNPSQPIKLATEISINLIENGNTRFNNPLRKTNNTDPVAFELFNNYPNPFNPVTSIKYSIPKDDFVTLKIYDLKGELITTLVNENQIKGEYEVNFNAKKYASGVYFYVLESGQFIKSKKMVLIK